MVDDGSTDATCRVAAGRGRASRGEPAAGAWGWPGPLRPGWRPAWRRGADIIVNTDADNQYEADDIQRLVEPILAGRAQLVVGDRGVATVTAFSPGKRRLQRLGSWVIGQASGVRTPDATSGFRALTRDAALRTLVLSEYSYTLETLIQAGARRMAVEYVPVRTNPPTRPSRLMTSQADYLANSTATILRAYTMYRPLRVFFALGGLMLAGGTGAWPCATCTMWSSARAAATSSRWWWRRRCCIVGFQVLLIGLLADLIGFNRKILEEVLYRQRRSELGGAGGVAPRTGCPAPEGDTGEAGGQWEMRPARGALRGRLETACRRGRMAEGTRRRPDKRRSRPGGDPRAGAGARRPLRQLHAAVGAHRRGTAPRLRAAVGRAADAACTGRGLSAARDRGQSVRGQAVGDLSLARAGGPTTRGPWGWRA